MPSVPGDEDETVRDRVADAIGASGVVVFCNGSPPGLRCRFSRRTLAVVRRYCDDYETVDTSDAPEAYRAALAEFGDWATVPQVYVDGECYGDCDVLAALTERGELAAVLGDGDRSR